MGQTKNLQGTCQHCGMPIEYPAEAIGSVRQCPFCRKQTELTLAVPEIESGIPRRIIAWSIVAVIILLLGITGVMLALRRAQSWADQQRKAPPQVEAPAKP